MRISGTNIINQEHIGVTLSFYGPFGATQNIFCEFTKTGNDFQMLTPIVAAAAGEGATSTAICVGGVPVEFRPPYITSHPLVVMSNSAFLSITGVLAVTTDGDVIIYREAYGTSTFAPTGLNGWAPTEATW